jgi:cell division transport system permease protein
MAAREERYYNRRIRTYYFSTVVSITLVLFMMGMLGMIILHAKRLSDYVKENIGFSIMIKDGIKESDIFVLQKELDAKEYVKSTEYIPKDKAAIILKKELGEDFIGFLGYNPLLPAIDLRLKANFATPDEVARIEKALLAHPEVKEVFYQKSLVEMVNQNIERISMVLLGFSALLLLISIALINNTIRLSVYSRRFTIRTMQLVGATRRFILRPFILTGIFSGLVSAVLAIGGIILVMVFAVQEVPDLLLLGDPLLYAMVIAIVVALGILIPWFSTWFAVRRFLVMKTDDLYS